jgi:hypothetical protein
MTEPETKTTKEIVSATRAWTFIDRKIRDFLIKFPDVPVLQKLEHFILNYLGMFLFIDSVKSQTDSENQNWIQIPFTEPTDRLVTHGVTQYYSLTTKGDGDRNKIRTISIKRPLIPQIPNLPLNALLRELTVKT